MKRLYWADAKRLLAALLLVTAVVSLCSCRTTAGTDHDQIVKASIELADLYVRLQRYDDALSVYDRALQEADDYRLYYNKALVLSTLGQNSDAANLCSECFERYPQIISFKIAQARYLRLAGEKSLSRNAYLTALELDPFDRETRAKLIEDLIEDGESDKAYEQALTMWEQGYRDERTIRYLYALEPDKWRNVFHQICLDDSL